jgi:hypothetical protein
MQGNIFSKREGAFVEQYIETYTLYRRSPIALNSRSINKLDSDNVGPYKADYTVGWGCNTLKDLEGILALTSQADY